MRRILQFFLDLFIFNVNVNAAGLFLFIRKNTYYLLAPFLEPATGVFLGQVVRVCV